ncbi:MULTISPECIES: DUF1206 domain-containing protein [Microbacterium]|uniref:DUF1206 domain-containing protein n=1 Tax=Microbacterium TaxID=33882 RepID=UPI00278344AE|nr:MULTISPECIES: DUF1206 domain-containing protein [Microbacterium]MDQ1082846.1 hypothetical protein [Microbacterium sp. SORGH_AS_0344]MDQ1168385.1 hypothetical protein [Microbacterium proteolyticum]
MTSASAAADKVQDSRPFEVAARVGYVVLGLLHLVIGLIAIGIATGGGGENADQSGALQQVRDTPFGPLLLWVIVVGLAALAVWQIAEAVVEHDGDAKKRWAHRAKFVGTAVAYIAIAATAFTLAVGGRSESAESSKTLTAQVLAMPGGVALLVIVGLGVAAIGVAFVIRGVTRAFKKHMSIPSGNRGRGIRTFGTVGYVAKGIAVGVAGILFVVAAFTHDPNTAGGIDSALRSLAGLPFGQVVLWLVGAGLVVYGVFCFARARYAQM